MPIQTYDSALLYNQTDTYDDIDGAGEVAPPMYEVQQSLNILAYGFYPPPDGKGVREAQQAGNDWAGTTGLELQAALNHKYSGNVNGGLEMQQLANLLAGTTGKEMQDALSNLAGGGHS